MTSILPLTTEKLTIRPFVAADAHEFTLAVLESVQTVGAWMSWCSPAFTQENALEWFATCDREREAGRAYDMGMFCPVSGCFLGGASINQLSSNHRYGNIGYWVRQSRQRQGIASHAVAMLCDFGFEQLGLFRLEIVVALGNAASEEVAVAAGATRECVARNRIFLHGQPVDAHIFALTPNERAC
ncbi:GNAT family N-acetyltransferase [Uliginosibacterium gangwonense]|uniref:GNAT family N-acetyltransferase n=1 Tax=Uliginosibacterium gangwonense TaxID=392736 RepID=UPI0003A36AEA|nr:GNAT family N-acetyltransferase [Uliginosibacterium gangwonense]